mgnify:CR=1 FL=1
MPAGGFYFDRGPFSLSLHGLLERIRDLNLKLISVTSDNPPNIFSE